MKTIDEIIEDSWTINMFPKQGWKDLNQELRGVTKDSSDDDLVWGFVDFLETWMDYNEVSIDLSQLKIKQGRYWYYDEIRDKEFSTKMDLTEHLRMRFAEYLLGD